MPRLPTITLQHRRTGRIEKRNRTEYSRNIARYKDWRIVTESMGDATDAQVRADARESKINQYRLENAEEQRWRGDQERRFKERAITEPIYTSDYTGAPDIPGEKELAKDLEDKPDIAYDDTWESMIWFKAAAYVKEKTGTRPRNKAHARRLMGFVDDGKN